MTKPTITKRATKGAALTYTELDANFQNLKDATITLQAGTGGINVTADLNGVITLVAGSNVTLTGNNSAKTITIDATGGGSGTVQYGDQYEFAYYDLSGSGDRVNNSPALYTDADDGLHLGADLDVGSHTLTSTTGDVVRFNRYLDFSAGAASYANNATKDFSNFSGMIIVNRQDTSGNVALWIVGSGNVLKLGDSTGSAVSGTISYVSGINGYRWTNNTGGTIVVAFAAIRTRSGA